MPIPESAQPFRHDGGDVGVLVCHGFTSSPRSVRDWASHLASGGHTVVAPRLPGHGTVWQELAVTSWHDWYACVDEEYRALAERCRTVFVAGLSMGGALALRLAEHHPDIAGAILVNPALGARDWRSPFAGVSKYVVTSVRAIGNDIARPGMDEGAYDRTPTAAVQQLRRLFADVRSCLDLVTCPLLVFRSATDHVVPVSSTQTIRRLVSSEELTEVVLERSYHVATMDHDAAEIFAGSLEFVNRVSRG